MSESVTLQSGDSGRTISRSAWNKMCKSAFGSAGKAICDPHEVRVLMRESEHLLALHEKGHVSWRRLSRDEKDDITAALSWLKVVQSDGRGHTLHVADPRRSPRTPPRECPQKPPTKFYEMRAFGDGTKPRVPTIEAPDEFGRILAKRLGRASGRLDDAIGHAGRGELRRVLLADPSLGREAWREVGEKLLAMVRVSEVRVEQF